MTRFQASTFIAVCALLVAGCAPASQPAAPAAPPGGNAPIQQDAAYDFNDLIPSVRKGLEYEGKLYAAPFYGESSALFYRKDILQKAGVQLSDKPTWDEVAAAAKKLHNPPNQ